MITLLMSGSSVFSELSYFSRLEWNLLKQPMPEPEQWACTKDVLTECPNHTSPVDITEQWPETEVVLICSIHWDTSLVCTVTGEHSR